MRPGCAASVPYGKGVEQEHLKTGQADRPEAALRANYVSQAPNMFNDRSWPSVSSSMCQCG